MNTNNIIIITTNADSNSKVNFQKNIRSTTATATATCIATATQLRVFWPSNFFVFIYFFDVGEGWPEGFEKGV